MLRDDASMPTLAEELLLVTLDPQRDRPSVNRRYLRWGLAAALLLDLEAAGTVAEDRGRIVRLGPTTGNPLLDGALAKLPGPQDRPVPVSRWLQFWGITSEELTARSLGAAGAVESTVGKKVMGFFVPNIRYRLLAKDFRERRLAPLWGEPADALQDGRTRALFALVQATKLARKLKVARDVRGELRFVVDEFWQTRAVRAKIVDAQKSTGVGGGGGDGGD